MQSTPSDPNAENREDVIAPSPLPNVPDTEPQSGAKSSIWSKAKGAIGDVSGHAAKIAAIGTAGAAKTAELGRQSLGAATDVTRGAIETGKSAYSGSTLAAAIDQFDERLEKSGAKQVIADSAGAVIGRLDQVTGKRLVDLLEEKLRAQDAYNNVLATRLAEALERIAKLETRLNHDD